MEKSDRGKEDGAGGIGIMTPEEIQFIRAQFRIVKTCGPLCNDCEDREGLLSLLVEEEAQARYWHHFAHTHLTDTATCNKEHTFDEFEIQVKKEWGK